MYFLLCSSESLDLKWDTLKDTLTSETTSSDEEQLRRDFFGTDLEQTVEKEKDVMGPATVQMAAPKQTGPVRPDIFQYVETMMKVHVHTEMQTRI